MFHQVRGLQCKDLDCDEAKAIQWIFQIRDHYNDANPYHNWRHACGAAMVRG